MSAEPQPTSAAAVGAEEKPPEALPAAFRRMPVEASDLMKVLPHRHPFVFLDRLIELDPGRRAVGIKNVSVSDPVFAGHFPGEDCRSWELPSCVPCAGPPEPMPCASVLSARAAAKAA